MTSERQRDLDQGQDNGDRRPRAAADANPEVRLALLERDHHDLEETVTAMAGTVGQLCDDVRPVIAWVTTQMQAAQEKRRWWEGLFTDAIKHALGLFLSIVGTATLSLIGMAWANPQAFWDAYRAVKSAMGGS